MNKLDLVATLAAAADVSKKSAEAGLDAVLSAIGAALKAGDTVKLAGFGAFSVRTRKARTGVKPGTTTKISIPASKVVGFKASKTLKDSIR
jgi:DNA-binding protein HU-beta